MRILFLHSADSLDVGPWSSERWDLVVDLGRAAGHASNNGSARVIASSSYGRGIADAHKVRDILATQRGKMLDDEGIDWWDLISLLYAPDLFFALQCIRFRNEIEPGAELWASRQAPAIGIIEAALGRKIFKFGTSFSARSAAAVGHYAGLLRKFSAAQLKEILLDKYDADYGWRSRLAQRSKPSTHAVVLIPSAYGNVSRMAAAYAELVPPQSFLLVATRASAKNFAPLPNVAVRDLAAYGQQQGNASEVISIRDRWMSLRKEIHDIPELAVLGDAGVFSSFAGFLTSGISARNAWRTVLKREPVSGVFCGDDSNLYTRLAVLLASRRKIPTLDFHHGAFDGRYILKDLASDLYLAKNEMERDYLVRVCRLPAERIVVGAPRSSKASLLNRPTKGNRIVLFSEPYEAAGLRTEQVYADLLPGLCRLAREANGSVNIKLHPFESRQQRSVVVRRVLSREDAEIVTVIDGPLTDHLFENAWFGITVESTTVMDCLQRGVPCFLCGWLSLSPYEYGQQYSRFGVGEMLSASAELRDIPARLKRIESSGHSSGFDLAPPIVLYDLLTWLTTPHSSLRPVS